MDTLLQKVLPLSSLSTLSPQCQKLLHSIRIGRDVQISIHPSTTDHIFKEILAVLLLGALDKASVFLNKLNHPQIAVVSNLADPHDQFLSSFLLSLSSHLSISDGTSSAPVVVMSMDDVAFDPFLLSCIQIFIYIDFNTKPLSDQQSINLNNILSCLPSSRVGRQTVSVHPESVSCICNSFYPEIYNFTHHKTKWLNVGFIKNLSNSIANIIGETGAIFCLVVVSTSRASALKDIKFSLYEKGFPTEVGVGVQGEVLNCNARVLLLHEKELDSLSVDMFDVGVVVGIVEEETVKKMESHVRDCGYIVSLAKETEARSMNKVFFDLNIDVGNASVLGCPELDIPQAYPSTDHFLSMVMPTGLGLATICSRFNAFVVLRQKSNSDVAKIDLDSLIYFYNLLDSQFAGSMTQDPLECGGVRCTCNDPPIECWVIPINETV
ncbi:hypothetical protein P9112_008118 [Eukaryota sp. TZLM1-RC]